jgi:N-acetylmuramoyl-L-alanine amidase
MSQHVRLLFVLCIFAASVVLNLALGLTAGAAAFAAPQVTAFRIGAHPDKTRIVLEFSGTGAVQYRLQQQATPPRLLLDLTGTQWQTEGPRLPLHSGAVQAVKQTPTRDGVQLALETRGGITARKPFFLPAAEGRPLRLVLDLVAGGAGVPEVRASNAAVRISDATAAGVETPVQAVLRTASVPIPQSKPRVAEMPSRSFGGARRVIVIDAGHGGKDPGAIGPTGTHEKDITLRTAIELRDALARTGRYTVHLTRSDDRFIILRDRTRIAQRHKADLFLSLHADSHARPDARGLSVYTLSETASDREAAALAARENKADLIGGVDLRRESNEVSSILIDLVQRETMNLSARYAQTLVTTMERRISLLQNPHRFAGFMVLKAPDTPSVLLEMGFISNQKEEWQLKQRSYRGKIIDGIVEATNRYFDSQAAVSMR